jgi:hypothetical protein
MAPNGPTTPSAPALLQLRLAPWQPKEPGPLMLGSLNAVLRDFAPQPPLPLVPAQRTTPDVSARLHRH